MRKDEHCPATVITYTVYSRFESNENLLWPETKSLCEQCINDNMLIFLGGEMCFL